MHIRYKMHTLAAQWHIGEAVRAAQSAEFGALLRREINHYEATDTCVAGERI